MAKFRVLHTSFIGGMLVHEGHVISFHGIPGHNLEPVDDEACEMKQAAAAIAKTVHQDSTHTAWQKALDAIREKKGAGILPEDDSDTAPRRRGRPARSALTDDAPDDGVQNQADE